MARTSAERKRAQRATERGYALSRECDWRKQGIKNASYQAYLELIISQHSVCAMPQCGASVDTSSPLDHDHATGLVRGVLCQKCNLTLGQLEAGRYSTACLYHAAEYLAVQHE